jgi:WXG100 family type VII secretion target
MGDRRMGNLAAMQELANLFNKHSRNLDQLIRDLNSRTESSKDIWDTPGAERFRSAWREAKTSFDKMSHALDAGGQDIKKSAQRLDIATQ